MRASLLLISMSLTLGSCSSPPKPPTVDESLKRPANAAVAVELQVCKSELQNTRILASETTRLADSASQYANDMATRLALQQQALAGRPTATATADRPNAVYTVLFAFGSAQVAVPEPGAVQLVEQARTSALVMLRGRTDGATEAPSESRIARDRAAAVRAYLVQAGIDPGRIRTTWQPVGDHSADNGTPGGRDLNRRVEIELYRVPPQAMGPLAQSHL
jgi:outer membrane protein OmpA-like peptidoglycan-associated protein